VTDCSEEMVPGTAESALPGSRPCAARVADRGQPYVPAGVRATARSEGCIPFTDQAVHRPVEKTAALKLPPNSKYCHINSNRVFVRLPEPGMNGAADHPGGSPLACAQGSPVSADAWHR
jgi:hypothetical protein